jgi:hypothetical protein
LIRLIASSLPHEVLGARCVRFMTRCGACGVLLMAALRPVLRRSGSARAAARRWSLDDAREGLDGRGAAQDAAGKPDQGEKDRHSRAEVGSRFGEVGSQPPNQSGHHR